MPPPPHTFPIQNPNRLEQFKKKRYISNAYTSNNNPSNNTSKKEFFEEINLFRGFSVFLIVWMHIMSCMFQQDLKVKNSWTYLEKIINTLFSDGTAYFMFISGMLFYLIFYKRSFNQKFFFSKLKKVFFPYFVCSLVLLFVNYFVIGTNHLNSNFILYRGFFYWSLWYIPTIMVLFFFSPCFVFFYR